MHRPLDLLPLQHTAADSPAARRGDVRIRLIVGLATVLAVVMSTRAAVPLAVLAGCLVWLIVSRAPLRAVVCRLTAPLVLAAVVCLVRTFMTGATPLASFDLGPLRLTATWEGLGEGLLIGCRVLGSVGVVVVLCLGVTAPEMFAALRWARLPHVCIEIAMLMYRYIFLLFEQALSVMAAQRVRLGYAGFRRSIGSLGSLAGIVILRSVDQAESSYEAMLARGYHGALPIPSLPALRRRQIAVAGVWLALVATAYVLAERWL